MTLEQSIELAELEAEIAAERFLEAFEEDQHPAILDQLHIEAELAHQRYENIYAFDLAH